MSIRQSEADDEVVGSNDLDGPALTLLCLQQLSSSFSFRSAEFAFALYFVVLYTNTLLPASLYGFITTGSAILLSGSVGGLVDRFKTRRLKIVRFFILIQKILVVGSYTLFYVIFLSDDLRRSAQNEGRGQDPNDPSKTDVWLIFAAITLLGCFLTLSNVGVSVSIERDWVTSISQGSTRRLNRLNAIMRRIDLLSKLLAPLFTSLFTTVTGYSDSCIILLSISAATSIFELVFIGIVYRRFSILAVEEKLHMDAVTRQSQEQTGSDSSPSIIQHVHRHSVVNGVCQTLFRWARGQYLDWKDFGRMPTFISSVSISLLYMSVLSFDSTFIAYLKSETTYSDAFIAGMRAVCVVAGLLGTFLSPYLSDKIGLVRTGSWSLWAELLPLTLCIVSFYEGAGSRDRPAWNTALLFTGLVLSRIGLWSFDLAQLAQIQNALSLHPRRNALMGLQFSLQNVLDLGHYAMTIIYSRPSSFRTPANISYGCIGFATLIYVGFYARRERGHLVHLDKLPLRPLLGKKTR